MKIVLDFDSVYEDRIVELAKWLKKSGMIKRFQIEDNGQKELPISDEKDESK